MNTLKDEKEKHDTLCEWTNTKKQNISSHRRKDDDTKMNKDWVSRAKERSYKQANEGWTDGLRNRGSVHKDEQIVVGGGKINLSPCLIHFKCQLQWRMRRRPVPMLSNCLATRIVFYWNGNTLLVLNVVILFFHRRRRRSSSLCCLRLNSSCQFLPDFAVIEIANFWKPLFATVSKLLNSGLLGDQVLFDVSLRRGVVVVSLGGCKRFRLDCQSTG